MNDVATFISVRQREEEVKRAAMVAHLQRLAGLIQAGEITGYAIVSVRAAGGRPACEWRGTCSAESLAMGIGCLSTRFFMVHGSAHADR